MSQNSYICALEQGLETSIDDYCASAFDCKEILKYKVIDLSTPFKLQFKFLEEEISKKIDYRQLINKSKIFRSLQVWPMIVACSFTCTDPKASERFFKSEYVISQLLMQCLNDEIIGITYHSNKITSGNIIASNIAIPMIAYDKNHKFGNLACKLRVTDSMSILDYKNLNLTIFSKDVNELCNSNNIIYHINTDIKDSYIHNSYFFENSFISTFNQGLSDDAYYLDKQNGLYYMKDNLLFDEYILRYNLFKKIKNI